MARKLTEKQHAFVVKVFKTKEPGSAYYGIYKCRSMAVASACASRLLTNAKIQELLEELREKAVDASVADVLERKQILTEVARGRITDYTTCGPDRDLIDVGPESPNTAALQEVTSRTEFDKDGAGVAVITKLKLHDPTKAIDLLNRMDKLYGEGATVLIDKAVILEGDSGAKGQLIAELNRFASRIRENQGDKETE